MTQSREHEISQALRQLVADHHHGRLSLAGYRRLRRALLEKANSDEALLTNPVDAVPANVRSRIVVWLVLVAIVLLLASIGWLLLR